MCPPELISNWGSRPAMNWMKRTALIAMGRGAPDQGRHTVALATTRGSLSTFLLKRSRRYRWTELYGHFFCQEDLLMASSFPERSGTCIRC